MPVYQQMHHYQQVGKRWYVYCRGFTSTENSAVFQECYCAILKTFWVATWPMSLSLCFRDHSSQGTLAARRLPLQSSVCLQHYKQTSQWQKSDLKVDTLILCNMTFSSIHVSFGWLHHRLKILRFKNRLPIIFKALFGSIRLKWRLYTDSDNGTRTEITKLGGRGGVVNNHLKQGKHTAGEEYSKLSLDYKKYYERQTLPIICVSNNLCSYFCFRFSFSSVTW